MGNVRDYVQSRLDNLTGCHVRAQAIIDYSQLTPTGRNQLIRAVDEGLLRAQNGQVPAHYALLASYWSWPTPHRWTPNATESVSLRVPNPGAFEPMMLLIFPVSDYWVELDHFGVKVERKYARKRGQAAPAKPPRSVLEMLRAGDTRDRRTVEHAMRAIENGDSVTIDILT